MGLASNKYRVLDIRTDVTWRGQDQNCELAAAVFRITHLPQNRQANRAASLARWGVGLEIGDNFL